jgi:glucose/arabinose dehydrogenase
VSRPRPAVALGGAAALTSLAGCGAGDQPARTAAYTSPSIPVRPPALARSPGAPTVTTVARGLEVPWEIAFLPDGRALITERPGRLRLLGRDRRLLTAPVARIPVGGGDGGLLGLAVDPDFPRNRFVYMYRTTPTGNEVFRSRLVGSRLLGRVIVLGGIPPGRYHDGGRIHFGPDRRLYVSTGDSGQSPRAQDRGSLAGKFLRLGPTAYRGARAVKPEIFSQGHRNPQGFDWEPGTGRLLASEHGPSGDDGPPGLDEINILRRGANYGWPVAFGNRRRAGFTAPAVVYARAIAPAGTTFVARPGSRWSGDVLVACLRGQQIRRVRLRGGRAVIDQPLFAGRYGRLRAVTEGPDGALYVLTSNRDGRITPRTGDDRVLRIVPPTR